MSLQMYLTGDRVLGTEGGVRSGRPPPPAPALDRQKHQNNYEAAKIIAQPLARLGRSEAA